MHTVIDAYHTETIGEILVDSEACLYTVIKHKPTLLGHFKYSHPPLLSNIQ